MTTKETLDVLAAATAVTLAVRDAKTDDGVVSRWEAVNILLKQRKPVLAAWDGIGDVGNELLDLTPEELPALIESVKTMLAAWDLSHRSVEISEEVILAAVSLAASIRRIINLPPSALPA